MSYKLITFKTPQGARAGVVVGDAVYDAAGATGRHEYSSVLGILQDWDNARSALREAASHARSGGVPLAEVELLAPLPNPGAVICTGSNYRCHSDAMDLKAGIKPKADHRAEGVKPFCFLKPSRCVVGPSADIAHFGAKADWEAELAAVIGRRARNVSVEEALKYVAGYTIANDLSARHNFFRPYAQEDTPFRFNWFTHKCFDGACPTGPALVPAEFVDGPDHLNIKLWVNGELKQDSNTSKMIFNLAEQIAEYSSLITLEPGDLILTGTPAGTGAESGTFLRPGDVMKIEIEQLGALINPIV